MLFGNQTRLTIFNIQYLIVQLRIAYIICLSLYIWKPLLHPHCEVMFVWVLCSTLAIPSSCCDGATYLVLSSHYVYMTSEHIE